MEPEKECFAIGRAHSRAWYSAELSDARRDEYDGRNLHNRNQPDFPALPHDGETSRPTASVYKPITTARKF